jgi:hypothetical protein
MSKGIGMAASQPARTSARKSNTHSTIADMSNRIDKFRRQAEAKGRQMYEAAIRTGAPIAAKTEHEIIEMGARAIRQNVAVAKGIAAVAKDPKSAEAQRFIRETKNNAVAAAHGTGDAITFGAADHVSAGVRAAINSGMDPHKARQLYGINIAQERAQDRYEGEHYGQARLGGQIAGTIAGGLLGGPVTGALRIGKLAQAAEAAVPALRVLNVPRGVRIAEATKMVPSEYVALAGAGGLSGAAAQGYNDIVTGHTSSLGDYAGAVVGGGIQALGARTMGPASTGLLGGGVTSVLQDEFSGRPVSYADAGLSALAGGATGLVAGKLAGTASDGLPPVAKGPLGDELSMIRSWARLDPVIDLKKTAINRPGHPGALRDYTTRRKKVEAKFGVKAKLSPGQRHYYHVADDYQVDHFQPRDLAVAAAIPASQIASGLLDLERYTRQSQAGDDDRRC